MARYPATAPPEEDANDLQDMLRQHKRLGIDHCKKVWESATTLQQFANGEQWPAEDRKRMDDPTRKAPRLSINEIGPILQTLSGRQMMQRFDREYLPRNSEWAARAEAMTKVDRALMEACDAEQAESAAFKDGPGVQGVSWLRFYLDSLDADTPEQLVVRDVPVWGMIWDPNAREINLRDRTFHRLQEAWPAREVRAKWGDIIYRKAKAAGGQPWAPTDETGKSSRIPWAGQDGNVSLELRDERRENVLWIDYEEWKSAEEAFLVAQPRDPAQPYQDAAAASSRLPPPVPGQPPPLDPMQTVELDAQELAEYKKQYKATHGEDFPKEAIARRVKICYYYAYLCGDEILETDKLKVGRFTLTAMTGFRFPGPKTTRFVGLAERLVDAQKWNNVMISALIRNMQISPKGSLLVEEGFFKNRQEALAQWASPGGVITVARGKLSGGPKGYEVVTGGSSAYSQMVESLLQFYREAIPRLAGFNPASLGQLGNDLKRVSGVVVRSVQDAAMTSNAELFDSLRLYRKEAGRIILAFLRNYFEVEDIIRIIGEDAAYQQQPVMDPQTGQPATDPQTGQPVTQQVLVVPDKDFWAPDAWKGIAVEEVVPAGDALQDLWEGLTQAGALQILLQPQPDTGAPLFSSEDLVEVMPYLPAPRREKMRQRIQGLIQQAQQKAAQPPEPPPPKVSVSIKAPYDPAAEPVVASAMGMSAQQAQQQQPMAPPPDSGGQ